MRSSAVTRSGAKRARQQESLAVAIVAHADVAESIDDALHREDAVGRNEILDQRRIRGAGRRRRLRARRRNGTKPGAGRGERGAGDEAASRERVVL